MKKVLYLFLIVDALLVTIFAVWLIQSPDVLQVKNEPMPVTPHIIKPGNKVLITFDYCKRYKLKGQVTVALISKDKLKPTPPFEEDSPKICQKIDYPLQIPDDTSPDIYKIRFRTTYKVNPLKKSVVEEFYSEEFIVQ